MNKKCKNIILDILTFGMNRSPYYNPATQEIKNCKKGTTYYWHEYRHYIQDKNGLMSIYTTLSQLGMFILVFLIIFKSKWYYFIIPTTIQLLPIYILEFDAWIFAIKKLRKKKNIRV